MFIRGERVGKRSQDAMERSEVWPTRPENRRVYAMRGEQRL